MIFKWLIIGLFALSSLGLWAGERYSTEAEYHRFLKEEYPKINEWMFSFQKAAAKAQKEKKNLIVYFSGGEDCPACRRLRDGDFKNNKELYNTINQRYIIVYQPVPIGREALSFSAAPQSVQVNLRHYQDYISEIDKGGQGFGVPDLWIFRVPKTGNQIGWVHHRLRGTWQEFYRQLKKFAK